MVRIVIKYIGGFHVSAWTLAIHKKLINFFVYAKKPLIKGLITVLAPPIGRYPNVLAGDLRYLLKEVIGKMMR